MLLLGVTAAIEALTGIALLASPLLVGRLLLGTALEAPGVALGRLCGVALLSFAALCLTVGGSGSSGPSVQVIMAVFQAVIAACLAFIFFSAGLAGDLLWPAVIFHAGAALLLIWRLDSLRPGWGR